MSSLRYHSLLSGQMLGVSTKTAYRIQERWENARLYHQRCPSIGQARS